MICNWIYLPFTFASFIPFASLVVCESVGCNGCSFFASRNGKCSSKSTKYIFVKIRFCTKKEHISVNYVLRYVHKLMLAAKLLFFLSLSSLIINFSCSSLWNSRLQRAQVCAILCMLVAPDARETHVPRFKFSPPMNLMRVLFENALQTFSRLSFAILKQKTYNSVYCVLNIINTAQNRAQNSKMLTFCYAFSI